MYTKILVAADGSPTADHALHEAARLAQPGAQLLALVVNDNTLLHFATPYGINYDTGAVRDAMREQCEAVAMHCRELLNGVGVIAETRILDLYEHPQRGPDVASAILSEAQAWGADLIVVGTHGRRGVRRMLLGSVAEQVLRQSDRPVLLVRGPEPSPA